MAGVVVLVAGTGWLLIKDAPVTGSDIAAVLVLPVAILSLVACVVFGVAARSSPPKATR